MFILLEPRPLKLDTNQMPGAMVVTVILIPKLMTIVLQQDIQCHGRARICRTLCFYRVGLLTDIPFNLLRE